MLACLPTISTVGTTKLIKTFRCGLVLLGKNLLASMTVISFSGQVGVGTKNVLCCKERYLSTGIINQWCHFHTTGKHPGNIIRVIINLVRTGKAGMQILHMKNERTDVTTWLQRSLARDADFVSHIRILHSYPD